MQKDQNNKQKEPFWRWFVKTSILLVFVLALMLAMYDKGVNNGRYLQCADNNLHLVLTHQDTFECVDEDTYNGYLYQLEVGNDPFAGVNLSID